MDKIMNMMAFYVLPESAKGERKNAIKARMAKKESKTDQRRAETESMRAETLIMKRVANRPAPVVQPPVSNAVPAPTIIQQAAPQAKPQVAKAGFESNKIIMIIGVLLVGGFIYNNMKNKQAGIGVEMVSAPPSAIT